jgi:cytochrome c oxidase subunit IV
MAHSEGHGSPVKLYWIFCVILCLITFMEWTIFKYRVDWSIPNWVLVTTLLAMSLVKFVMVVGWYMHLKYDPPMIKQIVVVAILMIVATGVGLGFLMA